MNFRQLSEAEESEFRDWAREPVNQTQKWWDKREILHPVIRDEWKSLGFAGSPIKE